MGNRPAGSMALLAIVALGCAAPPASNPEIDPEIAAAIESAGALDHHAHPTCVVPEGQSDSGFDAIHLEGLHKVDLPVRLRPDSDLHKRALQALWGTSELEAALQQKQRIREREGEGYPAWVLDRLGIDVMLANRTQMGPGLQSPRFAWVAFADPLVFPFDAPGEHVTPDRVVFYGRMQKLLAQHLAELDIVGLPPDLDGYLSTVLRPTLIGFQEQGAVGVKLLLAYLRSLNIAEASEKEADRIYRALVDSRSSDSVGAGDYKLLQDYLIRAIFLIAGELDLAAHIHTGAGGGAHFQIQTSHPLLLEPLLKDPRFSKTTFVLVHGGWPFSLESTALLSTLNVYADISGQSFLIHPQAQSEMLRHWLNWTPEKVFFGTDAYPYYPGMGWEESAWMWSTSTKRALGLALTAMLRSGEVSRERALEIAGLVMWENAAKLYGLDKPER